MTKNRKAPDASCGLNRRTFLTTSLGAAAVTGLGAQAFLTAGPARASGTTPLRVQFDWLMGNGQIGDIVAREKGYFAEEGLDVEFAPGGPNAQTLPPVLTGQSQMAEFSSTAQFLVAAGAGRPVKLFACGYQFSPYAYISLPKSPIRTPQDLVGKTIAVNPNGRFTLDLIMNLNGINKDDVRLITQGADMTPLLVGQADAVTGFMTNTSALAALGPDYITMTSEDAGLVGYANAYFSTQEGFEENKDALTRYIAGAARGWGWAFENRTEAVDIMCDAYPNLDRAVEHNTVDIVMSIAFGPDTKTHGWGWFDKSKLERQVEIFNSGNGFIEGVPVVENVVTHEILEATSDVRPKL